MCFFQQYLFVYNSTRADLVSVEGEDGDGVGGEEEEEGRAEVEVVLEEGGELARRREPREKRKWSQ